jgi:hypothetical protein
MKNTGNFIPGFCSEARKALLSARNSEAPGLFTQCDESLGNDAAKCLLSLHPEEFSGCSLTLMLSVGVSKEEEEKPCFWACNTFYCF